MPVDGRSYLIAFTTGFSIFALEVVWFRAMRAAFQSEMDAFAIMLCVVLLPLAVGAVLARRLARRAIPVEYVVGAAGAVVLLSTPLVERFDVLIKHPNAYLATVLVWFGTGLAIIGPAALVAGMPLPLLLDRTDDPRTVGRVYAVNTIGAALGSICTAWLLLPALGLARVSWLAGAALLGSALVVGGRTSRLRVTLAGAAALGIAIASEGGIGRLRVQGPSRGTAVSLLAYHEGPDSTVAVIEPSGAPRQLLIDGFTASSEKPRAQYMEWIGRLPMLLHPDPRDALVICYGTGQTANAVRNERVERLDVVELNAAVLSMAPLFRLGGDVLADRRTRAIVMDGRAWLRRTDRTYDVVTLEPMPPNFAGVNALYSVEFYELVASRLSRDGVVAQWVPFHLVTPEDATSIAATFVQVFPDALLWVAPADQTGILVGRRRGNPLPIGREWPGLKHAEATRSLSADEVLQNVALGPAELAYYAQAGSVITDDNQRLAYGRSRARKHFYRELITVANLQEVARSRSAR
jgi:spermidine synthase